MPDIVKIILPIALVAVIALLFFLGFLLFQFLPALSFLLLCADRGAAARERGEQRK